MRLLAAAVVVLALPLGSGCSAVIDPDESELGLPPPNACQPGTRARCACGGGLEGLQTCNALEKYDPCVCHTTADAGIRP
jgi:hypothetical protein